MMQLQDFVDSLTQRFSCYFVWIRGSLLIAEPKSYPRIDIGNNTKHVLLFSRHIPSPLEPKSPAKLDQ